MAIAGFAVRHPRADARADLLADTSSPAYARQVDFARTFGADPVVVVIAPKPGHELLTPDHMVAFATLEGNLAGRAGVQRVYGPGTLVNTLAAGLTAQGLDICTRAGEQAQAAAVQAAAQAGKSAADQQAAGTAAFESAVRDCTNKLAAQFPNVGLPAVNNPAFYGEVLLEQDGKTVRPFWTWALPDREHALITVRMKPDASVYDVIALGDVINKKAGEAALSDTQVMVTGAPALTASLAVATLDSLGPLLVLTVLAMVVVTILVLLRVGYRLLAVPLAGLAAFWTAGIAAWVGLPITPATLAVLPVVLGLGTDYALQAANRLAEETGEATERAAVTAGSILPATAIAAAATAAGVLAFAISPVPMVRQFALYLAIGVVMCWLVSALVGMPVTSLLLQRGVGSPRKATSEDVAPPAWGWVHRFGSAPLKVAVPLALIGIAGWAALPFLQVETDVQRLMPADSPALAQARQVEQTLHLGGEVDLVLAGPDVLSPAAQQWMDQQGGRAVAATGGRLRELNGLTVFLKMFNRGRLPTADEAGQIVTRISPYFSQAVVSHDRHQARTVFAQTSLTSVADDRALVAQLNSLPAPPSGYTYYPAGLAAIAAAALDQMRVDQVRLNLLAIALVLLVLGAAYRRVMPALLAVTPTVVAAGWAMGVIYLAGYRASPITVLLAGVVVAFATEFSVLWLARYRRELAGGWLTAAQASEIASRRVGPAIVASALALVLGFLLLAVSPVPIVRDFGIWSGADLALATMAVLLLLPPAARAFLPRG